MLIFCSNTKCSSEFNIISNTSLELRSKQPFDFDTALRCSIDYIYHIFCSKKAYVITSRTRDCDTASHQSIEGY